MKQMLMVAAGLMLCSFTALSQHVIKGIVVDSHSKEPLVGVSIMDLTNQSGAVTQNDGTFSLELSDLNDSLLVSYTGYNAVRIPAGKAKLISLKYAAASLDELIVTASRQVQKRTEAPVAISVISRDMLQRTKPVTLDHVLNKVSGVYMVDLGNEQHTMAIRQPIGYRSNFLYLQDGIPIRTIGDFNHNALIEINQAAIQRIEVVKGPSSSLYGSDAIGGVVNFITRKPAAIPEAKVSVEGSDWG